MEYKKMRDYSHEELVNILQGFSEQELLDFSASKGGYPVLLRMLLDERLCHIPILQDGSAVIVENENKEILLQQRSDNGRWGLPGGCQDLGEDLRTTASRELFEETGIKVSKDDLILIDIISGDQRKRMYPNGDIVYNNTSLYLAKVNSIDINLNIDSESIRLEFFNLDNIPKEMHDADLIEEYKKYISRSR